MIHYRLNLGANRTCWDVALLETQRQRPPFWTKV